MTYGLSNGYVADDVTQRCCEAVRSAILATAWLLVLFLFVFVQTRKPTIAVAFGIGPIVDFVITLQYVDMNIDVLILRAWDWRKSLRLYGRCYRGQLSFK